jgi:hypothetical protein
LVQRTTSVLNIDLSLYTILYVLTIQCYKVWRSICLLQNGALNRARAEERQWSLLC